MMLALVLLLPTPRRLASTACAGAVRGKPGAPEERAGPWRRLPLARRGLGLARL